MKKYIYVFLLLSFSSALYFLWPYWFPINDITFDKSKLLSLQNGKFRLNNKPHCPIAINYTIELIMDKDSVWPCSSSAFSSAGKLLYSTKDSCLLQLKTEMELIKEKGFNSIRITGIGEEVIEEPLTGRLKLDVKRPNTKDTALMLWNEKNYNKYFHALQQLLHVIDDAGLKAILLLHMEVDAKTTEIHLKKTAHYFRNDTTLFAYDFFNGSYCFDTLKHNREAIYKAVKCWNSIAKKNAPRHLTTIGLKGGCEVVKCNPNTLDVDFLSIIPQEQEQEKMLNQMEWYSKYIQKPWIKIERLSLLNN